jgi:hypothetical protein
VLSEVGKIVARSRIAEESGVIEAPDEGNIPDFVHERLGCHARSSPIGEIVAATRLGAAFVPSRAGGAGRAGRLGQAWTNAPLEGG